MSEASPPFDLHWDDELHRSWEEWLRPYSNKVHFDYELAGSLDEHVEICFSNAAQLVRRASEWVALDTVSAGGWILDHGSSAGFNGFALASALPRARVAGIDPDAPAVSLAAAMASRWQAGAGQEPPFFMTAVGEDLPFRSGSIDLIVSVTVLEHVSDVERCIEEMARVLRPGGRLYLEAPNYVWPHEPHLGIVMPPASPKWLIKLCARAQGSQHVDYLDHLKLIRPRRIESAMTRAGLDWTNVVGEKLDRILAGGVEHAIAYRRTARLAHVAGRMGIGPALRRVVLGLGLYPSMMYVAERR